MTVRARFAPSPTGPIHIGNIRTALFNYLFVKSSIRDGVDAKMILRIEDTDTERSKKEYEDYIFQELKWLGITWDEAADIGGEYGPYRQSERLKRYEEVAKILLNRGCAYYCYCSEDELFNMRKEQSDKGVTPGYDGRCRNLSEDREKAYKEEGRKPVIRFKVPANVVIKFEDMIKGSIEINSDTITDFVIVRSDGMPTYNFTCVVDDYDMEITHVIRGEDHIPNTPKQILMYNALGYPVPAFGHPSMILGPDRTKLSKRHGDNFIGQYREKGYLPDALFNFMALLGWSPDGEEEILSREQIENIFRIEKVAKNPAVFDIDKLNWMNGIYIRQKSVEELVPPCKEFLIKDGIIKEDEDLGKIIKVVAALQENLVYLGEISEKAKIFFGSTVQFESEEAKDVLKGDHVKGLLEILKSKVKDMETIEKDAVSPLLKEVGKEAGVKGKDLFMPIRVALTGQLHGPEMNHILSILGVDGIVERLDYIAATVLN